MPTISVYFIPLNKVASGAFKPRAIQVLEQLGVINGFYDREGQGFAAGEIILFEYAVIYDNHIRRLVPQATMAGFGAVCTHCNNDVDQLFCETVSEYYDSEHNGEPSDMAGLELTCGKCNTTTTLEGLKYTQQVSFETQYIQFNDLEEEISPSLLSRIQMRFGMPFQLIYERM